MISQGTRSSRKIESQVNHYQNMMVKSNIDIRITSNISIVISTLGSTYVSENK